MLEGQPNFRDLGGYQSAGGGRVVAGQVFRSGDFSALTDRDMAYIEDLGVRTVVDLRSELEARSRPDRLPATVSYRALRVMPAVDNSAMEKMFRTGDFRSFPSWESIYRSGIRDHSTIFSSLIRMIAEPDARPLVFHCATGKDRTGIAAALLLAILGVSWDDIQADYLLSNERLLPFTATMIDRIASEMSRAGRLFPEGQRAHLEGMMLVDAAYLDAARDEMTVLDGSVAEYLVGSLGIDEFTFQALREQLLE